MSLRRTVMSGLAFLVQPFAATATTVPRSSSCFFGHSLSQFGAYDLPFPSIRSLTTCRLPSVTCQAHFGADQRQFSSSEPLFAAPAAAAKNPRGNKETQSPSSASSSPRKSSKRAAVPKRRKPKFSNKFVEAAAAGADLLDIELLQEDAVDDIANMNINGTINGGLINTSSSSSALVFQDDAHPIREHLISRAAWTVLLRLRSAGHEAYIVGGTVRDILLNQIPKDYDILTSAEPSQIEYMFPRAFVLGRSFPICHVHHHNEVIEVSSFSTNSDPSKIPLDVAAMMEGTKREGARKSGGGSSRQRAGKKGQGEKKQLGKSGGSVFNSEDDDLDNQTSTFLGNTSNTTGTTNGQRSTTSRGPTWATARHDNAIKRDFRVNGLLYDPFSRILYDYVGGTADCTARILRTMGSPTHSFTVDPARMLRAVRLAARAGLTIEQETSEAMSALAVTTAKLPQGRLQMELVAMFTHGAALESMKLLWKYGLLDMLLPHHAVMLSKQGISREEPSVVENSKKIEDDDADSFSALTSSVLFSLLGELDKTASSTNPAETAVWVAALAAPLVAQECQREIERRAAAKVRRLRREEEDEEERSSSSSSNEWYDVIDDENDSYESSLPTSSSNSGKNTTTNGGGGKTSMASSGKRENPRENNFKSGVGTPSENSLPSSPEYLEIYGKIVDKVMLRLLTKPDAKTQKYLARIAPFAVPVGSGGVVKRKKLNNTNIETNSETSTGTVLALAAITSSSNTSSSEDGTAGIVNGTASLDSTVLPVLACVLPRQAVEAARSFLKLEAELRGVHDLESLVDHSEKRGGGGGSGGGGAGKKRSGAQQPRYLGRLKRGTRRKLNANEYTVLQLLRAPSVQWVQATQLALDDEEEEEENN